MKLAKRYENGRLTLGLIGELDHHSAGHAMDSIAREMEEALPRETILDLSGLTFMDSSGLAVVLHLYRTCARSGREFAVRGTPPQPMRVFEAAGLPQVMVFERGKE